MGQKLITSAVPPKLTYKRPLTVLTYVAAITVGIRQRLLCKISDCPHRSIQFTLRCCLSPNDNSLKTSNKSTTPAHRFRGES